VLGISFGLGAL